MVKLTENQVKGLELLNEFNSTSEETSVCTKYAITEKTENVKAKGFSIDKVNQLNAIWASLVQKELVAKKPIQYGDKMLTHYWLLDNASEYLAKEEN